MSNELLWVIMVVVNFLAAWLAKRFFGLIGLYLWMAVSLITANILVLVQVTLVGLTATLGNVTYNANFMVTDILCENQDARTARKAVWVGFFSLCAFTLLVNIGINFMPAPSDWALPHMQTLFTILPRIVGGSLLAYFISQLHDVWLFDKIKRLIPARRFLWIRNNVSTLISQLIDTLIFCFVALWGVIGREQFLQVLITTYMFKVVMALLDTPMVYLMTKAGKKRGSVHSSVEAQ